MLLQQWRACILADPAAQQRLVVIDENALFIAAALDEAKQLDINLSATLIASALLPDPIGTYISA